MFPSPFPHPILCGFSNAVQLALGWPVFLVDGISQASFCYGPSHFLAPFPMEVTGKGDSGNDLEGGEGREFLSHQKILSLSLYWILTIGYLLSLSTHLTISSNVPHHMIHLSQVQQSLGGDSPRNLASFNSHPIQQPWSCACGLCPSELGRQVCRQFFLFLSPVSECVWDNVVRWRAIEFIL